jgi:hypothetical protein
MNIFLLQGSSVKREVSNVREFIRSVTFPQERNAGLVIAFPPSILRLITAVTSEPERLGFYFLMVVVMKSSIFWDITHRVR